MSDTTTPMNVDQACRIVANRIVSDLINNYLDTGEGWEDYPDIGEHDWNRVGMHLDTMAKSHAEPERFAVAYALLEDRAEH